MADTKTEKTVAAELREAAARLRKRGNAANPGPWRMHDTHLDSGGHTATVLTSREDLNETELVAWLPTFSHEPWNDGRNAWCNAAWIALVHPGLAEPLASWLESWDGIELREDGPLPSDFEYALRIARVLNGTAQ